MNYDRAEQDFDFLVYELPEFLGANFLISTVRSDSYIAGLSMGGYGVLAHGLLCPKHYAAVGAVSTAIRFGQHSAGKDLQSDMDLYVLLKQVVAQKADLPRIFMSCG